MHNAETQMSELTHGGTQSRHLGLSIGEQTLVEDTNMNITARRHHGGQVKQFS